MPLKYLNGYKNTGLRNNIKVTGFWNVIICKVKERLEYQLYNSGEK